MKSRIINPEEGVYAAKSDYVHAIEITGYEKLVFVSGTMGLEADGRAPKDLNDQLRLVWSNIRRILADADMSTANIVRVTRYLTDAAFAPANQDARIAALGTRRVPTTAIVVETLLPEWLVEIEILAAG